MNVVVFGSLHLHKVFVLLFKNVFSQVSKKTVAKERGKERARERKRVEKDDGEGGRRERVSHGKIGQVCFVLS